MIGWRWCILLHRYMTLGEGKRATHARSVFPYTRICVAHWPDDGWTYVFYVRLIFAIYTASLLFLGIIINGAEWRPISHYKWIELRFWVILLMTISSVYTGLTPSIVLDNQVNKTAAETLCVFKGVCSDDSLEAVN